MALEDLTGTDKFISNLNSAWPVDDDWVDEGDNHIRGVKNVLKNTFPDTDAALHWSGSFARFPDGTASAPGISWVGETNTGWYRLDPNDMRLVIGGTSSTAWTTTHTFSYLPLKVANNSRIDFNNSTGVAWEALHANSANQCHVGRGGWTTTTVHGGGKTMTLDVSGLNVNQSIITSGHLTAGFDVYANRDVRASAGGFKPGGGPWSDSSDARIKTVRGGYEHGLAEIRQVNPVRYAFKGNYSSSVEPQAQPVHAEALAREFIGVIAQEIEVPMPETVSLAPGYIDGQPVEDVRILDTNALTYALINAVKELALRVEGLEARVAHA